MTQFWIGSTDVNGMLCSIGSWHVGCVNDRDNREAVRWAIDRGYVRERVHRAPAFPEGVRAYELTDTGLAHVRQFCGEKAFKSAGTTRKRYRDYAKKWRTTVDAAGTERHTLTPE